MNKDGACNVYNTNVPSKERNYIRDIFTTLIDTSWSWILLALACVFAVSWLSFASAYFAISWAHGDLTLTRAQRTAFFFNGTLGYEADHGLEEPCIAEIATFLSAFLFSVETQHTIGYGHRLPSFLLPSPSLHSPVPQVRDGLLSPGRRLHLPPVPPRPPHPELHGRPRIRQNRPPLQARCHAHLQVPRLLLPHPSSPPHKEGPVE